MRRLLSRLIEANRHRTTDVFVVGYPKTGNTWLRFFLGRYLQLYCHYGPLCFALWSDIFLFGEDPVTFANQLTALSPDVRQVE